MGKHDLLTQYIPLIKADSLGEWVIERTGDGTLEHPFHMPFVHYSELIHRFEYDLLSFCDANPQYNHRRYGETLKSMGLSWDMDEMTSADVSNMDAKGIIALLIGALRAEHFCDGALLRFLKNGSILRWLERLQQIDLE